MTASDAGGGTTAGTTTASPLLVLLSFALLLLLSELLLRFELLLSPRLRLLVEDIMQEVKMRK
jgi:hypothetical protein